MTGDSDCRAWVEQDLGPYHLDGDPLRADLTDDRTGVPLTLAITLRRDDGTPVGGAVVDVWHCDALGRYSGFPAPGDGEPTAALAGDAAERFLRGR